MEDFKKVVVFAFLDTDFSNSESQCQLIPTYHSAVKAILNIEISDRNWHSYTLQC